MAVVGSESSRWLLTIGGRGLVRFSATEIGNAELGPHPAEVIQSHRIVPIAVTRRLVFEKLEPRDQLLAAFLSLGSNARSDVAQHADRLIEGFSVVLVQRDAHELGLQIRWDFVRRAHGMRLV